MTDKRPIQLTIFEQTKEVKEPTGLTKDIIDKHPEWREILIDKK